MYIFQERLIKTKRIGRFHRLLPSLETLDTINRRGLPLGFFLLTLGIISGALWAGSAWGFYWSWDPKETWSLITWFAYAAMVHQRLALGWRGKRAALLALIGFALVMFTFLGVSVLVGWAPCFQRYAHRSGDERVMNSEILVIGLNHSTAPVQIREKITFPGDEEGRVTRSFADLDGIEEAMILSTCNRAEIIVTAEDAADSREILIETIGSVHGLDPEPFRPFLYVKEGEHAILHVFRVAASLDSMVVGETANPWTGERRLQAGCKRQRNRPYS